MKSPSSRPRLTQGCDFLSSIVETLSITGQKMAATVYERDNCNGDGTRERQKSSRFILAKQQLRTRNRLTT